MSISRHNQAVAWLNNLPVGWNREPFKKCATAVYGFPADSEAFSNDPQAIPLIRIRDITKGVVSTYFSGLYPQSALISSGDILIGMDGDFNIRIWDGPKGILNQRCCKVFGSDVLLSKFLFYCLTITLETINELTVSTTVKHLLSDGIENIILPLPSIEEQQKISDVLDKKISATDDALEKIQEQISLLEKAKKSIIHEAVTKGLDPNVPMKESGVSWLGKIPESWKLSRLRYQSNIRSGATPSKDDLSFWNGDIPWVSSVEVKSPVIQRTTHNITAKAVRSCSTSVMPQGTLIIVVRSGILQHTLPVSILGKPMAINQDIKAIEFTESINAKYFYYFCTGNNDNLLKVLLKDKSTVDNLSLDYLKSLPTLIPEIKEQSEIVNYLDKKMSSIDSSIQRKKQQLEILRQERQSLIFEYVTGKRRVGQD